MNPEEDRLNPLAEVFGFPVSNKSPKALRYREQKLCPFNNKVPNCTKDKANNPLGVCSILHKDGAVITCPVRFREDWIIVEKAAGFFFPSGEKWTSLTEVKLTDSNGQSAGNIDFVLAAYDSQGKLIDFASLEVQGVYISGNLRNPFEVYLENPHPEFNWKGGMNYPKPDYLSSSRKRLVPQMLYKGGIFKSWEKKQAVALQKSFFETLPILPTTSESDAEIAWFLYDMLFDENSKQYNLTMIDVIYTKFEPALLKITTPQPGDISDFIGFLQHKLDEQLDGNPPDAPTLSDILSK